MLTPEEIATWLSVSQDSVYRWIKQGKLPAIRLGRLYRVPEDKVLAMISAGSSKARGGAKRQGEADEGEPCDECISRQVQARDDREERP